MDATRLRSFGDLLREYRVAAGLTQETLAERARMSLAAVGKLERGARQRPYPATIALLADALSLSPNDRLELERAAHRGARAVSEPTPDVLGAINLPVHFSSFVGRERDLTKVGEMLATHRLVTLVGAGGVGKTRLAVNATQHFVAANPTDYKLGGVWFVDLSTAFDSHTAFAAITSSVGMEQCGTLEALIGYLRFQRFLLLLDNCEHLVDEVARLAGELLRHCPSAQILATSRQLLGIDGERVYHVPPLGVPTADADAQLSVSEAVEFSAIRLFVDRAEAADSRFELTGAIVPAVAEICRRLDGVALAIEIAAARTNAFPAATIAQRLDEHFLLFTGGTHGSLSRHRTMEAVFDWSYDLLDQSQRSVFRRLSVFVGGFTLELATSLWAAEAEASVIMEIFASLVDKSLLQCDPYAEPPRYKMLEPARQYAREKLREHDEESAAARAHASALLALAERFDSTMELIPDRVWDAYIERERDNFRVAFEWALGRHGEPDLAQRLAGSRTAAWCGFPTGEVRAWVRAAMETCDDTTPPGALAKLAITFARTATIHCDGNAEANLAASRRALSLQRADDLCATATAQYFVGAALLEMGRLDEADTVLREALAIARSCGAQEEYVFATGALSSICYCSGDFDGARNLVSEVLRLERAAGCYRHAANATVNLAELEFATGRIESALQLSLEAVQFFRTHRNWSRLLAPLCNSSAYLLALSRYQEAQSHAYEALRRSRALGDALHFSWALQHLAAVVILNTDCAANDQALRRAASMLGFVNELMSRSAYPREYTEQQEYEKMLSALRERFEEDELATLMGAGKEWSEDQALAEAPAI